MIEILPAVKLGESARKQISSLFIEGFGKEFTFFSKDHKKLANAFEHTFNLDVFYVALVNEEVAGMAACTNHVIPSMRIITKEFRKHLGFYKGTLAGVILKRQFEDHSYPFTVEVGTGSVEFVVTAKKYQRKGIASSILRYISNLEDYHEYILEVADINTNAINLYTKLGYKETLRVRQKHAYFSGINYMVYMKHKKQTIPPIPYI